MTLPIFQVSMAPAAVSTNNIATSQAPGAGAVNLTGSTVVGGVATLDMARRVAIASSSNDSGITFTITGTARNGVPLVETITGAASAGVGITTQDFLTVSSVTHTGTVASSITIGTSNTITSVSSPWFVVDRMIDPINLALSAVTTGTMNYSFEYTYDDPNAPFTGTFPTVWTAQTPAAVKTATGNGDGIMTGPLTAIRVTINSYTGTPTLKAQILQAGIPAA